MTQAGVWAVIPVKAFDAAKVRLSSVLAARDRAELARAMFEDVLAALAASMDVLNGLVVVTGDRDAAVLAWRYGARVLAEPAPGGINAGVRCAIEHLAEAPNAGMMVVPTDLPQLSPQSIAEIARLLAAPQAVAIVPATVDAGTNILACRPAGVIAPRFGPRSADLHCQAACRAGIPPSVVTSLDLGQDIDRPDDLVAFLAMDTATRTHAFLSRPEIAERLPRPALRGETKRAYHRPTGTGDMERCHE